MKIKVKRLTETAIIPTFGTEHSAGADLYADVIGNVCIMPGKIAWIGTGIAMEIPEGYTGLVFARSGLGSKYGISPANCVGVIDSDYRGEIKAALINHGREPYVVHPGERIVQIVIIETPKVQYVEGELSESGRGTGGFGSTGK